jgi:N-acetylglucosaminyl-diphospho-decaprenol L-rhamnosyltransferase
VNSFTILIVTYNSSEEISDLLNDLAFHTPGNSVLVIDNASQDGTADLVCTCFPNVHLVRNAQNIGYARAVNQGAAMCEVPYILLLNPDIRISDRVIFSEMLAILEDQHEVAAVAPLQFKENIKGRYLNFTWSYLSSQALKLYWEQRFHRETLRRKMIKITFLNAGCLMIRKAAFERVGKMNEKYFLYGEEPDLFLKFKRYGYTCILLPNVSIIHYRERSICKVKPTKRLSIRLLAIRNIIHALIIGWGCICFDFLTKKLPPERPQTPIH